MNPYADVLERESSDRGGAEPVRKKQRLSSADAVVAAACQGVEAPALDADSEASGKKLNAREETVSSRPVPVDLPGALAKLKAFAGNPK